MFQRLAAAVCIAALTCSVGAQQTPLNNASILKMHDAGMSDNLIITTINAQPVSFSTTTDDMIALKKAGITDQVIGAMIVKSSAPPMQSPNVASTISAPAISQQPPDPGGKPRVYLTSNSHGTNRNAVRDQSMEMSRDFERDCHSVRVTLNQQMADYTVSLNHIEVGLIIRDNQFQIADKNGDLIGKTKEGGSIAAGAKKACGLILENWDTIHSPGAVTTDPPK